MRFLKRTVAGIAFLLASSAFAANPVVVMKTSEGSVSIELYPDKAPVSVANFLRYVREGFYDGTIFHRVIDGFMIQGGGYKADMTMKSPHAPITNEAKNGLKNAAGTIAMARTSNPDSASSQFFINLVDNANLDYPSPDNYGYAVFGKVVSGFDVVQKIGKAKTGWSADMSDVPKAPILIQSVRVTAPSK